MKINAKSHKLDQETAFLDDDSVRELFETYEIVKEILDSSEKAAMWFRINNPHLGNVAPLNFFFRNRGHKVLAFVSNAQDENQGWDEDET